MSNKSFSEVAAAFAEACAGLIEHPDCPERVYRAISDFNTELSADLSSAWTASDEAETIRRNLPSLLTLAARAESLGVKHDEL